MDKKSIISTLKKQKKKLEKQFGIYQIGLFGSYARGTQSDQSDLDFVYVLNDDKKMTFNDLIQLEKYFHNLFKVENIELVNYKYMNPLVKYTMAKDVIYV